MIVISALQLRQQLKEIFDRVLAGEEFVVQYRGNKQIKLSAFSTKPQLSLAEKLSYYASPEYKKIVAERRRKYGENELLNEADPHQEKINVREYRAKRKSQR
jgi:antitoxin (DNA-binding transcriptional repressor) of toxin-antitoxin stability system